MKVYLFLIFFLFSNFAFADHKDFSCSDPFRDAPWNDFFLHSDIFAPWNDIFLDNIFAPWNNIFCTKESVNDYLRDNNVSSEYYWR